MGWYIGENAVYVRQADDGKLVKPQSPLSVATRAPNISADEYYENGQVQTVRRPARALVVLTRYP